MKLAYRSYNFHFGFQSPVFFDIYPAFVFRTVLGLGLRRLACIFKDRLCDNCSLRSSCPYSFIFETPVAKDNAAVVGRNRASHPFVLFCHQPYRKKVDDCQLRLCLFGKAIDYLPYIFHAFAHAGENGILRSRTKYRIIDVTTEAQSIVSAKDPATGQALEIEPKIQPVVWTYGQAPSSKGSKTVHLTSPFRLKINGRYTKIFSAKEFFDRLLTRAKMLCLLYGELDETSQAVESPAAWSDESFYITDRHLDWLDLAHYSARQKAGMRMGGAVGRFTLSAAFDPTACSLLEFGQIFHGGKNSSFGLGAMEAADGSKLWDKAITKRLE